MDIIFTSLASFSSFCSDGGKKRDQKNSQSGGTDKLKESK